MSESPAVAEVRAQYWRDRPHLAMLSRHLLSLTATWRCLEPLLPTARDMLGRAHHQYFMSLGALSPGQTLQHLPTHGAVLESIEDAGTALIHDLDDLWQRLQALQGEQNGQPPDKPAA
jgi:hypothetical protein